MKWRGPRGPKLTRRNFFKALAASAFAAAVPLPVGFPKEWVEVTGLEAAENGWWREELVKIYAEQGPIPKFSYNPLRDSYKLPRDLYDKLPKNRWPIAGLSTDANYHRLIGKPRLS